MVDPMAIDGGLRALIRSHFPPEVHLQAIETGAIGAGVPDLNWCYRGCEGWLELKATGGWAVGLRPDQVAWVHRRVRAGGRVHILTRRQHDGGPQRGAEVDELWVHAGRDVVALHSGGLQSATPLLLQTGGPRLWDWAAVLGVLTSPIGDGSPVSLPTPPPSAGGSD